MQAIDPKGSFLKNLLLSLLLIGVTSLLIPVVLKQIDDRKAADEQRLQDSLSRQDTVLDAQAALLDTMAADFWEYELYASDVVISRDGRFGRDDWHKRAVAAYYEQTGPLLGKIRADISTLLRLAPRATYESFLRLYNEEVLSLDACLLELMKLEQADAGGTPRANGTPQPARCSASAGTLAGATWETLADAIVRQDLAVRIDQAFADLAQTFRLHGAPE